MTEKNSSPMVRLQGISKHFGKVRANHNISLDIVSGHITALLGENGAGKSTLMSILAGKLAPDAGTIFVDGAPVTFRSTKDALTAGIGMVYQHFMLVDSMTVAENVLLGQSDAWLNLAAMNKTVAELADRYGLSVDPKARIASLSMGERQRVEILKLLYRDSRILILDEPTAVLTPPEIEQLFIALRRMAQNGKAIVFISHKMQEVLSLSDEVAILRRGEIVDTFPISEVPSEAELANRMVGREVLLQVDVKPMIKGERVLDIQGLSDNALDSINLNVRRGEVVAIAGVAGNGQRELVEIITGLTRPKTGAVQLLNKVWDAYFPTPPKKYGLAYIPEDRQGLAVCLAHNLIDTFLLTNRHCFARGPFLNRAAAEAATKRVVWEYDVQPGHLDASARMLSGGNLQKLVIGREFYRKPALIVAENPTQGLDIAATEVVWGKLLEARTHGGVLLVSGDLAEVLALADRIAVMYRGRIVDIFPRSDTAKVEATGLMMAGVVD